MSETIALSAQKRERSGKGAARTLRRAGKIPAIIYGDKQEEVRIVADFRELSRQYERGHFTSKIVNLNVDGTEIRVLPRQIQLDPVTDAVLHVDFLRIGKGSKMKVQVAVEFINADKSPGLKRGGVLNVVRRDVELMCDVDNIPTKLIADLDGVQIGHSIHISNITIPAGATPTITDRDFTIATLVGRSAEDEDLDATPAAEAAEGAATPDAAGAAKSTGAAKPGGAAKSGDK